MAFGKVTLALAMAHSSLCFGELLNRKTETLVYFEPRMLHLVSELSRCIGWDLLDHKEDTSDV